MPHEICVGLIVPLLEDKRGDASLVNMYRCITLSTYYPSCLNIHCVSKKTSPTFLAITRESIDGFL